MNNIWGGYLEDYHYIKVIVPIDIEISYNHLYLSTSNDDKKDEKIALRVYKEEHFGNERHLHLTFDECLCFQDDYLVNLNDDVFYQVQVGKITQTDRFDIENFYNGPLGIEYTAAYTIFRIWTPIAKEVIVCLDGQKYQLKYQAKGLWEIAVNGDFDGYKYYYEVRINQKFIRVLDPYGIASDTDNNNNYVIDLHKTYQMKHSYCQHSNLLDTIIYEINIRDFSIGLPVEHPGTYLGLPESVTLQGAGLTNIKELGVTHLQIMPFFAFGGVLEGIKDATNPQFRYNWGYNPVQYNVPSGFYATDAELPYARINELKQMIDKIHEINLAINMDVVYNHVYRVEEFSYGLIVPGYFYRTDDRGFRLNSSWCGNDLATSRLMIRKFIIDSLLWWQKEYKIDGYRFDLMGLLDTTTLIEAEKQLKLNNSAVILYGEGWKMATDMKQSEEANFENYWAIPTFGFFNDLFRNTFRGSGDNPHKGFLWGNQSTPKTLKTLFSGGSIDEILFKYPSQSINYLECHDNYTLVDQMLRVFPNSTLSERIINGKLAAGLILMSLGIPFIQLGQERLRTKDGMDNSYQAGDVINRIPWYQNKELYLCYQSLITIRKKYDIFKLNNPNDLKKRVSVSISDGLVELRYLMDNLILQIFFKNNYKEQTIYFAPNTTVIYDGDQIVSASLERMTLVKPGVYIFEK